MLRIHILLLVAFGMATTVSAEEAKPDKKGAKSGPAAVLEELEAALDKERQAFFKKAQATAKAGGKIDWSQDPAHAYRKKFLELAAKHPKTDAAAGALVRAATLSNNYDKQGEILKQLLAEHPDSVHIGQLLYLVRDPAVLRDLSQKSPHREVRGKALYHLAIQVIGKDGAEGRALLERVQKEYGEVKLWGALTLGQKAKGELFQREHLRIGKVAPEIEGEDVDGVVFKLSDYRGKVILLDFWGDW